MSAKRFACKVRYIEFRHEKHTTHSDSDSQGRSDAASTLAELLVCAKASVSGASPPADDEEWCEAESKSLLRWAHKTGRFVSASEFSALISGFRHLAGGYEHDVFFKKRSGRVLKITKPPKFGAMWELGKYLQNLIWCNEVFDDDLRIEGVIHTHDGASIVISQPYISGTRPTVEQIEQWFKLQGFRQLSPLIWENEQGLRIADAHEGNFILRNDGVMMPIDLHVERLSKGEHL